MEGRMMRRWAMLAAAVAMAVLPGSAIHAQPQADPVTETLDLVAGVMTDEGFAATGWEQRGTLAEGGEASFRVKLTDGRLYTFSGACGEACGNLDLHLTDAKGREVDSDVEDDTVPIVAIDASGTYTVRVVMKACSASSCAFGIRGYRK